MNSDNSKLAAVTAVLGHDINEKEKVDMTLKQCVTVYVAQYIALNGTPAADYDDGINVVEGQVLNYFPDRYGYDICNYAHMLFGVADDAANDAEQAELQAVAA